MKVQSVIKVKLDYSEPLINTMREFSKATQWASDYAFKNKINSWKDLHNACYYPMRKRFHLNSQLTCKAIKLAKQHKKAVKNKSKSKPIFKELLNIEYDHRSFSVNFKKMIVSLSSLNGRIKLPVIIPKYFHQYLNWEVCAANLNHIKGSLYLNIIVAKGVNINNRLDSIVGVDLGINNIAVTSNRLFFKGIKSRIAQYHRLRSSLQSKGTRSAKRKLKRLSGREQRFQRDINHCISKTIIGSFNTGTIVMEDLSGIRKRRKGRTMNRLINNWSFYQLQSFMEYKALRKGVEVIKINPAYTSKTCLKCGSVHTERPLNRGFFHCLDCGYSCNSDLLAACNIAGRLKPLVNSRGLPCQSALCSVQ